MDYEDYVQRTQRAANLVQTGLYAEALEILESTVKEEISQIDKSVMCLNVAVVYDKMEEVDHALEWYDQGIAYERPLSRVFVAMHKAGYLATRGYVSESLQLYKELSTLPFITEADKETIRRNILTLQGQADAAG